MNIARREIGKVIKYYVGPNKASGYDLLTGQVIKQLPRKQVVTITQLLNAALKLTQTSFFYIKRINYQVNQYFINLSAFYLYWQKHIAETFGNPITSDHTC